MLLISGKPHQEHIPTEKAEWIPVVLLIVLTLLYGFALDWLGFILSTILFLVSGFRILGENRWRVLLQVSVPFVLVFWFCLTQLLSIYLAPGKLFSSLLAG